MVLDFPSTASSILQSLKIHEAFIADKVKILENVPGTLFPSNLIRVNIHVALIKQTFCQDLLICRPRFITVGRYFYWLDVLFERTPIITFRAKKVSRMYPFFTVYLHRLK